VLRAPDRFGQFRATQENGGGVGDHWTVHKFGELHRGRLQTVEVLPGCCVLTALGDGMASHPGIAARLSGALGEAGINIRASAQGASEGAVHAGFHLSPQPSSIGLIGLGVVGSALEEVAGEGRVPSDLRAGRVHRFREGLPARDGALERRRASAAAEGTAPHPGAPP
jgi:hypothetical protein